MLTRIVRFSPVFIKRILALFLVILIGFAKPEVFVIAEEATASVQNDTSASSSATMDLGPTESVTPSPTYAPSISSIASPSGIADATDSAQIPDSSSTLAAPIPVSDSSAKLQATVRVRNLYKRNFQTKEYIPIYIENGRYKDFTLRVRNWKHQTVSVHTQEALYGEDRVITMMAPSAISPGQYSVEISDGNGVIATQAYEWGILAMNPDRYRYPIGDTSSIAIAVLNDAGQTVCNADATLTVTSPTGNVQTTSTKEGSIIINPQCAQRKFTLIPDYQTSIAVGEEGVYKLELSATTTSGSYTISDSIEGVSVTPFFIRRTAPTRLYPPLIYPVTATVTATEDFKGVVTEVVPESFTVLPPSDPSVQGFTSIDKARAGSLQNEFALSPLVSLAMPYAINATVSAYPVSLGFGEELIDADERDIYARYGLAGHDGIDFEMPIGTSITAVDDGDVLIARENFDYGTTVILQHEWGRSYYGHLSSMVVHEGQRVLKREHIANSGDTGLATGPHLHFGLRPRNFDRGNGCMGKIDPAPYLGIPNQRSVLGASSSSEGELQVITWNVSLKAGESVSLGYQFAAPGVSPMFYTTGPLRFFGEHGTYLFSEGRRWQLAVDAPPPYHFATGRYVGSGNYKQVTGLGFAPEAVLIKASTTGGVGAMLKTSSMIDNTTVYMGSATADDATGLITLDPDGFTVVGTNANIANTTWSWAAWGGSDCSAAGQFCVGDYLGDGSSPRTITTGFQPDIAIVKRSTAVAATFQTVGMSANYGQYFMATAQDTTGALFGAIQSTGFQVGATNNTSSGIYHFVAFKQVAGSVKVGSFSGNGSSQSVSSMGFSPEFVITKNTTAGTPVSAVYNGSDSYGDSSFYFTDTANVVGAITSLNSDGFSVGSNSTANGSGNTIFWMAFDGPRTVNSSGTFKMATGTYVGNGNYQNFNGLGFAPDLVIIKGDTAQAGVFRITQHNGDVTSYLDSATADFALGIQSLNPDGFTIGSHATVNSNGVTYYWTAYGNAWRPATNSGASDFVIGTYYGNGIDSRNIAGLPFQPDLVVIKRSGASAAVFRTSQHSGDSSSFLAATADSSNRIQGFSSDGFQIGTDATVNSAASFYRYFAFKAGSNFAVGKYSGNGASQDITSVGFQPDNLWIKVTAATRGVQRTADMSTNSALPFINAANVNNAVTQLLSNGFSVGSAAETNTSGSNNVYYAAWHIPVTVNISGYIYQSNETTLDTATYSVNISVSNGSPIPATVPGDGTYLYSGVPVSSGNPIAVYIYNNANDANTFTVTDGTSNITGLNLIVGKVVVGNNNSGSTTNANICTQSNYPTASSPDDALFFCSGNNITAESGIEWHVLQNNSYSTGTSATLTTQSSGGALHVQEGGTATFASTGTIAGNVAIDTGATLTTSGSTTLNIAGNWTKTGTFTPNSGTVNFIGSDGSTQSLTGNTTFNDFTATTQTNSSGRTLQFTGNSTTTVVGTWTVTGYSGKVITLASSDSNTWTINPTNASVTYVNVSRSTSSGTSFCATYSNDGGNNSGWNISATGECVSGPTMDQIMRHGKWFNASGVIQPFTF